MGLLRTDREPRARGQRGRLAAPARPRQVTDMNMSSDHKAPKAAGGSAASNAPPELRPLTAAAERALAEAAARRAERDRKPTSRPPELHGRGGLDPTRYDDWEINGLAADF
jgi:hypothetical protein